MPAVMGKRVTADAQPERKGLPAKLRARPNFWYGHHPEKWRVRFDRDSKGKVTSAEFLPQLTPIYLDPGTCGVTDGQRGGLVLTHMRGMYAERGFTLIQPDDPRLGRFQWYVQSIPTQSGRSHHVDIHTRAIVEGQRVTWQDDTEGFEAFSRHLIEARIIQPISPTIAASFTERQERKVERLEGAMASNPNNKYVASKLAKAQAMLAAMKQASPGDPDPYVVKGSRAGPVKEAS